MGRHYVPRLYLRGFADEREMIWTFDRKEKNDFFASIENVAHETKFYPDELEDVFSREIETPTSPILRSIRARERINSEQKAVISRYFAAQLKRVPAGKERYVSLFPEVARNIESAVVQHIDALVEETPNLAKIGHKRKIEVSALVDKYVSDPPDTIWYDTLTPEKLDSIGEAIRTMTWRFFYTKGKHQFLTSDNPVFFFGALGLGNEDSELSVPLSRDIVLCADRRPSRDLEFSEATPPLVKEINRRTVALATRFVFAHTKQTWVAPFCYKDHRQLKSIR